MLLVFWPSCKKPINLLKGWHDKFISGMTLCCLLSGYGYQNQNNLANLKNREDCDFFMSCFKTKSGCDIFYPQSTFAEGRNSALRLALAFDPGKYILAYTPNLFLNVVEKKKLITPISNCYYRVLLLSFHWWWCWPCPGRKRSYGIKSMEVRLI